MFKKGIFLFILIVAAVQVHAEPRFVLVDIYHISEKNFHDNYPYSELYINKPHCDVGGSLELDEGMYQFVEFDGLTVHSRFGQIQDTGSAWRLYHSLPNRQMKFTAKVYCSYPIQCIKQ